MSTFDGVVKEYPLISIDNFLEKSKNFQSTVFFLSHCHSDHMKGLRDRKFWELLKSRNFSHIYMSDVSEHLLKNDEIFCHLSNYLVSLPIEQPTIIDVYDECGDICSRVVVTLLTAGHCPGSVMFLLEGERGRVLYTGDFRLPVGGSARLTNLHDENGRLKPLDSLYIDTTFCNEKCMYIPTREECLLEILKLVEEWLSKGPDFIVRFICPAQYAYEFVFVEIFKKFGEKTHVFEEKLKKYKGIKVIEDAVTSIPSEARVHACTSGYSNDFMGILYPYETPCGFHTEDFKSIKVRLIKPCAMFFMNKNYTEVSALNVVTNVHRVCFSTHSSLDEIRDMVKYLEPKSVYPNVVVNQNVEQILYLIGASVWKSHLDSLSPLGQLNDIKDESTISSTNSLPFYDDCYKIPQQCQPTEKSPFVRGSPVEPEVESTLPIPLQSGQTDKTALNEVLEPLNGERNLTVLENSNCDTSSPVKWECPIFSLDDENFDPNSSFSSPKGNSDSEDYTTSQEQNSAQLENDCLTPAKSKQSESVRSTINKDSVREHNQRKCSSGIRLELEKLLASQEPIVDDVMNSKSQAVTSTNCGGSLLKADLSVNASTNSGELIHKPSYTNPDIKLDSKMYCSNRNILTTSKELLTKTNYLSKPSFSEQENSGKPEIGKDSIQLDHKSNDQRIQCNQNQTTWRGSKLMLEVNKEACACTTDVEIDVHQLNSDKSIAVANQKANTSKTANLCTNNIVTNTNGYSNVIEQGQSSNENISKKLNNKSQSILKLPQFLNNTHLTRNISKSDSVVSFKASTSVAQRVIGKPKKSTKRRKSVTSKYKFFDYQSQHAFGIIGCPNQKTDSPEFAPFVPCFSKKIHDPFASKYEKSVVKFEKKSPVTKDSDSDILILPNINKCDKPIQLIDLSSDGYKSDVELFNCEYQDSELTFTTGNIKNSQTGQTSTSEISEDDSPSLLIPSKKTLKLKTDLIACSEHLGPGPNSKPVGRKRKSADESTFVCRKSPKHEVVENSHRVCDSVSNIDSTPDDLLPFTPSPLSSYLKKILGSEMS